MERPAGSQTVSHSAASISPRTWDITLIALAAGAVIWGWLTWQQALINKDGVRYVASAEAILQGDWQAAWHAFPWPFHPLIMAGVHFVTGLDLETVGYLVNLVYYGVVIAAFLAILRQLGASRPVLWFGAVLVLLHPDLNHTLPGIYRDQGFWAFFLLGLLCFLCFVQCGWWRYAIGSSVALFIATLFRIEGLVLLALLPFAAAWAPKATWRHRGQQFAKAAAIPLLMLVLAGLVTTTNLFQAESVSETRFQEPIERIAQSWKQVTEGLPTHAEQLSSAVLNRYSDRHAFGALLAAYGYVLFASMLRGINWLYVILAGVALLPNRMRPARFAHPTFIWLAAIYILMLAAYMIQEQFVSHRYAAALAFIVMFYASFGLGALFTTFCERYGRPLRKNWGWPLAMMALIIVGLAGLIRTGAPNTQEREAGVWINRNLPNDATMYFQNTRARYYADRPYETWRDSSWDEPRNMVESESGAWREYDYLVLTISHRHPERREWLETTLACKPIATFENARGTQVVIMRTSECAGGTDHQNTGN